MTRQAVSEEDVRTLLSEIRDLLSILAEAHFPAYAERIRSRFGEKSAAFAALLRVDWQREATALMNGQRSQAEIHTALKVDQGYFSKFVKKLRDAGWVEDGPRGPKLTVTDWELRALREEGR